MSNIKNEFRMTVESRSVNESFVRGTVAAFAAQLDPTLDEIADIKTAVSEAVTNCIVHAYKDSYNEKEKIIYITGTQYDDNTFKFVIKDKGCGIQDIEKAMQPLYTTDKESERSGMGLPIMKTFSDSFKLKSIPGKGTTVVFTKKVN